MADVALAGEALPAVLTHSYWILIFPLAAFVINGLWLGRKSGKAAGYLAIVLSGMAMLWAISLAWTYHTVVLGHKAIYPDRTLIPWSFDWLHFQDTLTARIGMYLDPISVMMLVVVTVIAFLVNVYSMGYMRKDDGMGRFFALISLFSFSMLGLVSATNLIQMFIFWELVGTSSYTLIGFWYHKPSAVAASKKAFIVTRFADAFFLLGIIITAYHTGRFDFLYLNSPAAVADLGATVSLGLFSANALGLVTFLIFMGGWGKSAMFPLHIWLPDAMEGPTPVSSIIHSATMVVAGVYLTARMFPLFAAAEHTLDIVLTVGAFTALFAAAVACTQKDIKRILAFSTLSQLGYMMFSLGAAKIVHGHGGDINALGYSASMFHVFTHAFFKCMLFLGAGAIIHVVHNNELDAMGGLRKRMPWTYGSLLIACLAIAGIFPFSGFWSKDEILLAAFQSGHNLVFLLGLAVGGLTAFYMFRFFFLIFHGEARSDLHHVHEDPWMTVPIVILAVPSVLAGWLSIGYFNGYVLPPLDLDIGHGAHAMWLPWLATFVGLSGVVLAWLAYGRSRADVVGALKLDGRPSWYRLLYHKLYIDEVWLFITHRILFAYVARPAKWFDRTIVDGTVDFIGGLCHRGGYLVRRLQTGSLPLYAGIFLFGILLIYILGSLPLGV